MASKVLFAPMKYARYEATQTLPAKFGRMLEKSPLGDMVNGKKVAIKMHVGDGITYSTIPPVFITILVDYIHKHGGDCFITDHYISSRHPERRGYTEANLGCPILESTGYMGKYFYEKDVDYKTLRHVDIAGLIHDADVLVDFSHVKGHGSCGFGGACKNIAMGCVTDRTRHEIHSLEGGLVWDKDKCVHCKLCIPACNHHANSFTTDGKDGVYKVNYHHCTMCQHCLKVCPKHAITLDSHDYADFQSGMALTTKTVLDTFAPGSVYFINVLTMITAPVRLLGHDHAVAGAGHRHNGVGRHSSHRARQHRRDKGGRPDPGRRTGGHEARHRGAPVPASARQEPVCTAGQAGSMRTGHSGIRTGRDTIILFKTSAAPPHGQRRRSFIKE